MVKREEKAGLFPENLRMEVSPEGDGEARAITFERGVVESTKIGRGSLLSKINFRWVCFGQHRTGHSAYGPGIEATERALEAWFQGRSGHLNSPQGSHWILDSICRGKEPHSHGANSSQLTQWVRGERAEVPSCLGQQWSRLHFQRSCDLERQGLVRSSL